jgi:hypothetical protein
MQICTSQSDNIAPPIRISLALFHFSELVNNQVVTKDLGLAIGGVSILLVFLFLRPTMNRGGYCFQWLNQECPVNWSHENRRREISHKTSKHENWKLVKFIAGIRFSCDNGCQLHLHYC